ncbi:MAG TPA: ATP-binding protein [Deltaproteobacteria bacterium]|nr:ATP-binding protein [Deltaproteobacteria bacterium]HPP79647.1 ATP-binding protein [Deltaproteobacteria bacterium]
METRGSGPRRFPVRARYTFWITVPALAVLIVLLAITVYSVHEKAVIELFGRQQATAARLYAGRIQDATAACGHALTLYAQAATHTGKAPEGLQAVHDELTPTVTALALLGPDSAVLSAYPAQKGFFEKGSACDIPAMVNALERMHRRYVGEAWVVAGDGAPGSEGCVSRSKVIVMGVPLLSKDGAYQGALVAAIHPKSLLGSQGGIPAPAGGAALLLDESGTVLFDPDPSHVGKAFDALLDTRSKRFRAFAYTHGGVLDVTMKGRDGPVAATAAFAPVRLGSDRWWVVLVTPNDTVTGPVRRASLNILVGACGLVVVVMVTAFSVARAETKRLRLSEELKRAREREEWQGRLLREKMTIEGIVQGSPVPMFVIDKDHKVILWNKACTELTGYSAEEMIGTDNYYKPFYEKKRPFLADLIIDRNVDNIGSLYGEGGAVKSETIEGAYEAVRHFPRLKGKDRHLYFLAAPIHDERGEIVAAIETFLDVTKEVELTRNLQEYNETLENELQENIQLKQEVEQLYRYLQSILDSLPDKVYELNKDGIINYVSRQITTGMFDPKGRHFTEYVAPEHREYAISKWEDAKRGIFKPYELELTGRDGKKRHLLMTPGPVRGTDRFVLVERDITELKELEKKYYESQKLAAIGQLSAGIAHEIRNPLSSIKMSLQILEKRMQPQGNDLKRFKIAQREVEHLEKLVSDVLLYAKPMEPSKSPCDLRQVADQAIAMVEKSIEEKRIEVHRDYPPDLHLVPVDPAMIGQALINVLQNAIDAMDVGGRLGVVLREEPKSASITVEDNGSGIDEGDMPYLFNPFFTKKSYGTGLGLTQVEKIVTLHGGSIDVKSRKGEGTRFRIVLPRNAAW